jgi:hypothetical protein
LAHLKVLNGGGLDQFEQRFSEFGKNGHLGMSSNCNRASASIRTRRDQRFIRGDVKFKVRFDKATGMPHSYHKTNKFSI